MEEEKNKEEETKEEEEGDLAEKSSKTMVDKANEAAERIEKANAKQEELVKRFEAAKIEDTLAGKAEAGTGKVEETPEEYVNKVMANDAEDT